LGADSGPGALAATERVFAVTAALLRLGSLVLLALALATAGPDRRLDLVGLVAAVEAAGAVAAAWRADRLRRWPVVLDLLFASVMLALTSGDFQNGHQSPLYNYAAITVAIAGLVDWPLWTVLLVAVLPNIVAVGSAVLPHHSTYPVWIAVPDGFGSLGVASVAWAITHLQRRVASARDRERAQAVRRAHELAGERERRRQADTLRRRLVSTLDNLAAPGIVVDPILLGQVRRESDWLRGVAADGLPDPAPVGLLHNLREVAAGKRASGLAVDLVLPSTEPRLRCDESEALTGAALEALTNVAKHAGTASARVIVTTDAAATVVAVVDDGCGYDLALVPAGLGQTGSIQHRMAAVGGSATVESAPGRGTRVTLRLPAPR
jgi:signal transduction histidine kinase